MMVIGLKVKTLYIITLCVVIICVCVLLYSAFSNSAVHTSSDNITEDMPHIVIDAGHGGEDGGAEVDGVLEKDINLNIANKLADILRLCGYQVTEIRDEDIEMEVYRSSGAGGQKVNKTSSAVRLIHKPTGIVVSCQTQRSQYQNKDYAMKMLRSKLIEIKEREHLEKISDIKGVQNQIAWGSQIRSYVFMPYTLAKDHRTGFENGNIQAVMDGDIDGFINAYLKSLSHGTLEK